MEDCFGGSCCGPCYVNFKGELISTQILFQFSSINLLNTIGKHKYSHHFFLRTIKNIFIQVIFPNIITYLDGTFKTEQNDINFKMK